METLFIYIVKVNIALAVFYLLYMLLFSKDTFLRLRRYYFLSAIIFSLVYPLFTATALGSLIDFSPKVEETQTSVFIGDLTMDYMIVEDVEETAPTPIDWALVAKNILLLGTVFFSIRFMWQINSILRIKSQSEKRTVFGYIIYHLKDEITPFSFFNWIFIHTDTHSEKQLKQILLHEHTHARQWHSFDILLAQILRIAFWWNPIVWAMKRDIAMNLEYLADQAVLQEGVDTTEYQYHILQLTYQDTAVQIVNNFNVSQLKQRIIMMNKNKSPMRKLAKYLSVLPLALLLIMANSIYAQTNVVQEPQQEIAPPPPPPPPPHEQELVSYKKNLIAIMEFIKTEMKYPLIAKENGIQGRVLASFTIEKDGTVTNPKIVEGVDPSLDKEAIRIINAMPKFEPFIDDGKAIKTEYTIPFHFDLDGKEKSNEISTVGFKVINAEEGGDVKVIGSGEMMDKPVQTLAEKFGNNKPIYFVDGEKVEDIENIDPKDIESISILKDKTAIEKFGEEGRNGVIEVTTKPSYKAKNKLMDAAREKLATNPDEVFVVVEKQPEFKGGMTALMSYLGENIQYPEEAHKNGIQGRVITNFVVNKDGSISEVTIVRGQDPMLDAEAIRVISSMPNWEPGTQRGEAVRVRFTLPVIFRLENGKDAKDQEHGNDGVISITAKPAKEEIFVVVEQQPEFPGGTPAMMNYLGENVKYPVEAQKNKIQGRVIVNFVVNKDGSLSDFKVVRGQDPLLDAEAIRVISTMPNWKPGMQRGQTVKVRYTLPIVFRLNEDKEVESENIKMLLGKPSIVSRRDQKTDRKFYEFISQRIKYPVIAQEKGITGVVRASYDVNSSGIVSNIKITKGADPSLDAELKRIIQLMRNDIALMRSVGKAA